MQPMKIENKHNVNLSIKLAINFLSLILWYNNTTQYRICQSLILTNFNICGKNKKSNLHHIEERMIYEEEKICSQERIRWYLEY